MHIENSTVYNTDDIRAFFMWARKLRQHLYETSDDAWKRGRKARALPKTLVVGYYSRTPAEKVVKEEDRKRKGGTRVSPYQFLRWAEGRWKPGRNTPPHRLGVVRPSKLYDSPLQQLAAVADDQMLAPKALVVELTTIAEEFFAVWGEDREAFHVLHDFQLRYSDRAKRGSRKAAAKRAKENRLESVKSKLYKCRDVISNAKELIRDNEAKQKELRALAEQLADELDIPSYERYF
jgi:hypothetical protein